MHIHGRIDHTFLLSLGILLNMTEYQNYLVYVGLPEAITARIVICVEFKLLWVEFCRYRSFHSVFVFMYFIIFIQLYSSVRVLV
jgi:uncharacterized membrane protein YagU involved in acid resistance